MSFETAVPIILGVLAAAFTLLNAWNWRGGKYLCQGCRYNNDDDCRKAERPAANDCLAFRE